MKAGTGEELESVERLRLALAVLQYNQGFVNFTDGKANSLLLVNSIFLATSAAGALESVLDLLVIGVAAGAVLLCLMVVYARMPGPGARDRADLVFFGHIARRRNAAAYQEDLQGATAEEIAASLGRQVYELAGVVERKFRAYRRAQVATGISAALWIARLLGPALAMLSARGG